MSFDRIEDEMYTDSEFDYTASESSIESVWIPIEEAEMDSSSAGSNEVESSEEDTDATRGHRYGPAPPIRPAIPAQVNSSAKDEASCSSVLGNSSKCDTSTTGDAPIAGGGSQVGGKDDVATCSICLEDISEGGSHRLVAIKCGHCFGESCILTWLNTKSTCPSCNQHAERKHVRVVFLACYRVADAREITEHLEQQRKAESKAAKLQSELIQLQRKVYSLESENDRLKVALQASSKALTFVEPESSGGLNQGLPPRGFYQLNGTCKYMAYTSVFDLLAVSSKGTSLPAMFKSPFGIEICSMLDLNTRSFNVVSGAQEIKDLEFHESKPWILMASLDSTARIFNVERLNITPVHKFQLEAKVWSCCWSKRNQDNVFVGLANGNVHEFDTRFPRVPVRTMHGPSRQPLPIVALKSLPMGVVCSQMNSDQIRYHRFHQEHYITQDVPVPGMCFSLNYHSQSSSLLVSCRPSSLNKYVTNTVLRLRSSLGSEPVLEHWKSRQHREFTSGKSAVVLSRPVLCTAPRSDSLWACCLDESTKSLKIFDVESGEVVHSKQSADPERNAYLQVEKVATAGQHSEALIALTKNGIAVYSQG